MSTGNRGRFSDRIKKIAFFKRNRKNSVKGKRNFKRFLLLPIMFFDKYIYQDKSNTRQIKSDSSKNVFVNKSIIFSNFNEKNRINVKKSVVNKDRLVDKNVVSELKKNGMEFQKNNTNTVNKAFKNSSFIVGSILASNKVSKNYSLNEHIKKDNFSSKSYNKEKIDNLNVNIISDISKYLIKNINNLELIESDLYVLSQFDGNSESLEKCRQYIVRLKSLQNKLNKIRKQFEIFKINTDFTDILDIDDKILMDKIIYFRDSISSDLANQTSKNYKLLAEYEYLYSRIDKVVIQVDALEKDVIDRKTKLENANIDFNAFQNKVYNIDKINNESIKIISKQDEILKSVMEKVSDISVNEKVKYTYKGFFDLFLKSIKLMGLYMLSPVKKTFPGITALTISTQATVNRLLASLAPEKRTQLIYSVKDYTSTLNSSIDDLSRLDNLIDKTLFDVNNVKREFLMSFAPYSKDLPKYNSVLKKIEKMQKELINNSVKVKILEGKMLENQRKNEAAIVKVRKLNSN